MVCQAPSLKLVGEVLGARGQPSAPEQEVMPTFRLARHSDCDVRWSALAALREMAQAGMEGHRLGTLMHHLWRECDQSAPHQFCPMKLYHQRLVLVPE